MTEKEILQLKEQVEESKNKTLQLKGQLKALTNQLKELGYKNADDAKKQVKVKQDELQEIDALIASKSEELEKYL